MRFQAAENKETGGSPFAPCEIRRSTNRKIDKLTVIGQLHLRARARKLELPPESAAPRFRQRRHDNSQRERVGAATQ